METGTSSQLTRQLGAVAISTNGVTWGRLFPAPNTTAKWGAVVYGEGQFVALDDSSSGNVGDIPVRKRLDRASAVSCQEINSGNVRLRQLRRCRSVHGVDR